MQTDYEDSDNLFGASFFCALEEHTTIGMWNCVNTVHSEPSQPVLT